MIISHRVFDIRVPLLHRASASIDRLGHACTQAVASHLKITAQYIHTKLEHADLHFAFVPLGSKADRRAAPRFSYQTSWPGTIKARHVVPVSRLKQTSEFGRDVPRFRGRPLVPLSDVRLVPLPVEGSDSA